MAESNLVLLCGLFKQTSAGGMEYLKGRTNREIIVLAGHNLLIFANSKKKTDKHPDFYLYSSPPRERGSQGKAAEPGGEGGIPSGTVLHREGEKKGKPPVDFEGEEQGKAEDPDDDIPF